MEAKQTDIQTETEFMPKFWELVKKFWIPGDLDDEQYWEDLVNETSEMGKKYRTEFCQDLIVAYIGYLDEEAKKGKTWREKACGLLLENACVTHASILKEGTDETLNLQG